MSTTRLLELASLIQEKTKIVDAYIRDNDLPTPSFNATYPPVFDPPGDAGSARAEALEAIDELKAHLLGPTGYFASLVSLQAVARLGMAKAFPKESTITVPDLAEKCRMDPDDAGRIIRHGLSQGLFCEPSPGVIAHSASTQAIVNVPKLYDLLEAALDNMWTGAPRVVDAMQKWPGSQELNETAFNLGHNTELTFFDSLAKDGKKAKTFADAMSFLNDTPATRPKFALDGYDWSAHASGKVVDVGGSHGVIASLLAEQFHDMKIIVQDRPEVHDFFTEQPVKDADVYFFRWILHDWSDKYCIQILRALIPALKKGARVVLMESVLPGPGVLQPVAEDAVRQFDMVMKILFNAKERSEADRKNMIQQADQKFNVVDVRQPEGSQLGFLVIEWQG